MTTTDVDYESLFELIEKMIDEYLDFDTFVDFRTFAVGDENPESPLYIDTLKNKTTKTTSLIGTYGFEAMAIKLQKKINDDIWRTLYGTAE